VAFKIGMANEASLAIPIFFRIGIESGENYPQYQIGGHGEDVESFLSYTTRKRCEPRPHEKR
jgi:hypothetical protein